MRAALPGFDFCAGCLPEKIAHAYEDEMSFPGIDTEEAVTEAFLTVTGRDVDMDNPVHATIVSRAWAVLGKQNGEEA
jgi:hypothetical protein